MQHGKLVLLALACVCVVAHAQRQQVAATVAPATNCTVSNPAKVDCGYSGITQQQCVDKGCCWVPINPNPANYPWCFSPPGPPPPPPPPAPPGPPFNASTLALVTSYLKENVNYGGLGAVIAAPDATTPGGSYEYHWMRDGALTMRAWYRYSNQAAGALLAYMESYVQWVLATQANPNPDVNGIDPRGEPKWLVVNTTTPGQLFTEGWCRPQSGAAALRAVTLLEWAADLVKAGNTSYVTKYLWTGDPSQANGGAIYFDLMYVKNNYQFSSCDIWENIESTYNFWITYQSYSALVQGAAFATSMGDTATAAELTAAAEPFITSLPTFWNGDYLIGMDDRQLDSSVVLAINNAFMGTPAEANFSFTAPWVVATVAAHTALSDKMFPINGIDDANGVPGTLYARFAGDTYGYDGAGPWILVTAGFAENAYRGASEVVARNALPSPEALAHYAKILAADPSDLAAMSPPEFALKLGSVGDGILDRIHYHIAPYQFRMSEQLDHTTGDETSALNLSWSYANVLKAMSFRQAFVSAYTAAYGTTPRF